MGKIHKKLGKGGFVEIAEAGNSKIWCFCARSNETQLSKDEKKVFFEISWTVVYAAVEIL